MKVLLVWAITCLIWSTVWLFIKLGLHDLPPVSFAGIRLIIAVAILLPFVLIRRTPLPQSPRERVLVAVTGLLLLGLNYGLVFWGAQFITSGLTAVLQAATPAFTIVFAHYLLPNERFTLSKLSAVALGVVGVAVIFSDQMQVVGWHALAGSAAVVGGALCVAFAYVLVKAHLGHLHPTVLTTLQMLCALVPLVAYGLVREGNPLTFNWTPKAVFSLLYLALAGSVAAFWLNYWLLKRMDTTKVMSMSLVEPLLAVLLGALVLGEKITAHALLGGVCILASIGLILSGRIKPARAAEG
ncbi:MAG: DMT family transporter [Acidobacteria bacterium]|nr:DMT family transporter [Acidobacteriota bacterium]